MKTLIVDRVKLFRNIIVEVLKDSGVEHAFANNGKEALEILAKEGFDFICTSLVLDDMDGLELCKRIRELERFRYTPVVLLTTESSSELSKRATDSGVTDIFIKNKINELVNFIDRFSNVNKPIAGRVLYIEDQKSQRDYVVALFRERGIEVDAFDNADDAWLSFLEHHYHLVVTDLVLEGGISGVALINKIRRLDGVKGETPILAVTAFDNVSKRVSLFHMGITDYVTKPIIREELLARVGNLIKNQRALEREQEFREHLNSEEVVRRTLKMEALGKLTGGIAHDFNNLLGVIIGYARLLEQQLGDKPPLKEHARQIGLASNRGVTLIRKLLGFTRKQSEMEHVVDINELLLGFQDVLEKALSGDVTVSFKLEQGELPIRIDPNDFQDALLNLSINAQHAMGDTGTLTIATQRQSLDIDTSGELGLLPGNYVVLQLCDTGIGMSDEVKQRIFDPFFSTKGEAGTGLGLVQVYGFVKRSGGAIKVVSEQGNGSCFSLYFPLGKYEALNGEESAASSATNASQKKRVLVVDDEEMLCNIMKLYLEDAGYEVDIAFDVSQAREKLKSTSFDLLITDIIMPGENGYALLGYVMQEYPGLRLMICSGYDDVAEGGVPARFRDVIRMQKPVEQEALIKRVNELMS